MNTTTTKQELAAHIAAAIPRSEDVGGILVGFKHHPPSAPGEFNGVLPIPDYSIGDEADHFAIWANRAFVGGQAGSRVRSGEWGEFREFRDSRRGSRPGAETGRVSGV